MQTITNQLWINQNGRIACTEHGGYSLSAIAAAQPHAQMIDTDLDNWIKVTADMAESITCEVCR